MSKTTNILPEREYSSQQIDTKNTEEIGVVYDPQTHERIVITKNNLLQLAGVTPAGKAYIKESSDKDRRGVNNGSNILNEGLRIGTKGIQGIKGTSKLEQRTSEELSSASTVLLNTNKNPELITTIAIEHIEGIDLKRALLTEEESLEIILQVSNTLFEMERRGEMHRDIKSNNIMVTPEKKAVIIDFATASNINVETGAPIIRNQHVLGTPMYLAPEKFINIQEETMQSEIFSLTVVLTEKFGIQIESEFFENAFNPRQPKEHRYLYYNEGVQDIIKKIKKSNLEDKIKIFLIHNLSLNPTERLSSFRDFSTGLKLLQNKEKGAEDIEKFILGKKQEQENREKRISRIKEITEKLRDPEKRYQERIVMHLRQIVLNAWENPESKRKNKLNEIKELIQQEIEVPTIESAIHNVKTLSKYIKESNTPNKEGLIGYLKESLENIQQELVIKTGEKDIEGAINIIRDTYTDPVKLFEEIIEKRKAHIKNLNKTAEEKREIYAKEESIIYYVISSVYGNKFGYEKVLKAIEGENK